MIRILGAILLGMLIFSSANASLLIRAGGLAYYDTDTDLTWVTDANLPATNTFGVTGINPAGYMTWAKANEWTAAMNTATYLGANNWRLPTTAQPDASCINQTIVTGFPNQGRDTGCTGSEMGHLFYAELGGVANTSIATIHNANYNLFSNLPLGFLSYWSGTEYAPNTSLAWLFTFETGAQFPSNKGSGLYGWAVRPGDIGAVPVPAAVWLMGSALSLLGAIRRKSGTPL